MIEYKRLTNLTNAGGFFRISNTQWGILGMYMAKMIEMCRTLYEKSHSEEWLLLHVCEIIFNLFTKRIQVMFDYIPNELETYLIVVVN